MQRVISFVLFFLSLGLFIGRAETLAYVTLICATLALTMDK